MSGLEYLKSCPLCRGEARISNPPMGDPRCVYCTKCNITFYEKPGFYGIEALVKYWNARPREAELEARNKELERRLEATEGALRYYAENKHWYEGMACFDSQIHLRDRGQVAEKALSLISHPSSKEELP